MGILKAINVEALVWLLCDLVIDILLASLRGGQRRARRPKLRVAVSGRSFSAAIPQVLGSHMFLYITGDRLLMFITNSIVSQYLDQQMP